MNEYKFSDLKVGLKDGFCVEITASMMNLFFELSGDNNPMHMDESYALSKGFKGVLVYGLLSSAFYSKLVGVHLPGKYCLLHGIDIQFSNHVYIGDELRVQGTVHYLNEAYK